MRWPPRNHRFRVNQGVLVARLAAYAQTHFFGWPARGVGSGGQ
jgi:hypothetical protein